MKRSYDPSCSSNEPSPKLCPLDICLEEPTLNPKSHALARLERETIDITSAWVCPSPSNNPLDVYNKAIEEWWINAFDVDLSPVDYQTNQFTREGIRRVLVWQMHQLRLNETPCNEYDDEEVLPCTQMTPSSVGSLEEKGTCLHVGSPDKAPCPVISTSEKESQTKNNQSEATLTPEQINALQFYNYWAPIILQLQLQAATTQQNLILHAANYNSLWSNPLTAPDVSTPISLPDCPFPLPQAKVEPDTQETEETSAESSQVQEASYSPMQLDVPDNISLRESISMSISSGADSDKHEITNDEVASIPLPTFSQNRPLTGGGSKPLENSPRTPAFSIINPSKQSAQANFLKKISFALKPKASSTNNFLKN